jgi:lipoyl(octanoyl) transferase
MGTCRVVIETEPQSGVRNMAIDEALLEAAHDQGECTVRWYRWNTATVSLGYFQAESGALANPELSGLPLVRRLTGGGAILHHHEWTYSCAVPAAHPLAQSPSQVYDLAHGRIIAALADRGVSSASPRGTKNPAAEAAFLCFGRGDPRDIVLCGHKIVGSAQRRRRGTVLQHGSLLLRRSEYAPQFSGVLDLAPATAIDSDFVSKLGESIGAIFGLPQLKTQICYTLSNRYDHHALLTPAALLDQISLFSLPALATCRYFTGEGTC